ncbi:MAG: methyl-accepting chemotaxis protein [Nitrospiraceae bacterium]
MKPPFYKRHYFLNDSCQPRIMTVNVLHQSLVFLAFSAALFIPLMVQLQRAPLADFESQQAATQILALHERVWPAFPVALVLVGAHSLFFSHRIAGPLYRFRQIFSAVAEGNLSVTARIRKHDYLHPEAERLDAMVSALRRKVQDIEQASEQSRRYADALRQAVQSGSKEAALSALMQIDRVNADIAAGLQAFTTKVETPPSGTMPSLRAAA